MLITKGLNIMVMKKQLILIWYISSVNMNK